MGVSKFLPILFLLFPVVYAANNCAAASACAKSSFPVRFPFRLDNQPPRNCGYPGFELRCNSQGITIFKFPYSGEFFVRFIDYGRQEIQLYDPSNCLAKRLLTFNISESPFMSAYYMNYSFLSCPSQFTRSTSMITSIDCLSNLTTTVLATPSSNAGALPSTCKKLVTLPVPLPPPPLWFPYGYFPDLNDDLHLTWSVPNCGFCEQQGAICGFKNSSSQQVMCFDNPKTVAGGKGKGLRAFGIITFSVAFCSFAVAFVICFTKGCQCRGHSGNTSSSRQQNLDLAAITPQPNTVIEGLDESTIESYVKVELGESRRLPGPWRPNHNTCPICLSEYKAKDTVRCIPECQHCFHADCIHQWLTLNATCPICRNSPSPSPAAHASLQHV